MSIDRVGAVDVEQYMAQKRGEGRSLKSVSNDLALLSSIFRNAIRRGWRSRPGNPVEGVERPQVPRRSLKLEFLDQPEFEALLRGCLGTEIGRQDRVMYLVAGMAGLRQGELLGLRWRSIDWQAMKIRAARDTFTRGRMKESGKSSAGGRGVPMAPLTTLSTGTPRQGSSEVPFLSQTGAESSISPGGKAFTRVRFQAPVRPLLAPVRAHRGPPLWSQLSAALTFA